MAPPTTPPSAESRPPHDTGPAPERAPGPTLQTGVEALVAVVVDQVEADRSAGRDTACFVSGYPGSPLGGFDAALDRRLASLPDLPIVHQRGANEELAATAVMGSQMASTYADARQAGVLGVWYGKAPGLDRAADALRHAVFAGTSPAGAVAFVGDDPANKSSTLPSASEGMLAELQIPVFSPATAQEVRDLGAQAIACSRRTGLWTAVKVTASVADGSGLAARSDLAADAELGPGTASRSMGSPTPVDREADLAQQLAAAARFGTERGLNHTVGAAPGDTVAVVVMGSAWSDLVDGLRLVGLGVDDIGPSPVRLVRVAMPFPLDRDHIRAACEGVDEVLVVEEKRPFLEGAVAGALYGVAEPPAIVGKSDRDGRPLVPATGALDGRALAPALATVLGRHLDLPSPAPGPPAGRARRLIPLTEAPRTPFFCSGCPHTTSLQVPDGAHVGVGIGCHGMVSMLTPERRGELVGFTQMGGEGAQWVGAAPFVGTDHVFQNLGDGTFAHSGLLAIRFAVASGVNLTYKVLYNSAVAMTGGQDAVGALSVPAMCQELLAEGVRRVVVTTEDPSRYRRVRLPAGASVAHRDRIVALQRELAATEGVTVLIHDQACAAELRRARKRGLVPTPTTRVVIDQRVCEGCGDCGEKSACLSLQPVETPYGTKTAIEQSSCNIDLACLRGDCPSFMTVEVTGADPSGAAPPAPALPPAAPAELRGTWTARLPGIGGTGVVTVARALARAGVLDGLGATSSDQTGLSQKAGPVLSEVHLHAQGAEPAVDGVDALLVMDPLTAATDRNLDGCDPDRTRLVGTSTTPPTGAIVADPTTVRPDVASLRRRLDGAVRPGAVWLDAAAACDALFGTTVVANTFVLGMACQAGVLPVTTASLEAALAEGPSGPLNQAAFAWGRAAVAAPAALADAMAAGDAGPPPVDERLARRVEALGLPEDLAAEVARRAADLVAFQRSATAHGYLQVVEESWRAEQAVAPGSTTFTATVAHHLHRVTAYKDEYEVARLLLLPESRRRAEAVGGRGATVRWNLHPPVLRAMGRTEKIRFGPATRPVMAALRAAKPLRGTPLDPFGRAEVRRRERALARDYAALCRRLARDLPRRGIDAATDIAGLVERVRGYEDVKLRNLDAYETALAAALAAPPTTPTTTGSEGASC